MLTVFKYNLEITDHQVIKLPNQAKIISVKEQAGNLVLYAFVNPNNILVDKDIHIIGTGNPTDEWLYDLKFIDTVEMNYSGSGLVWHVFSK